MTIGRYLHRFTLMLGLALAPACSGDGPTPPGGGDGNVVDTLPEDSLNFLRAAEDAPTIAQKTLSFWAVRGEDVEAVIWYNKRADRPDSTELVRFRLDERSLVNRPDGTPIAEGDSIQITISVVDTVRMILDFQPSGLRFAPGREADLKIRYAEADDDWNDDGSTDDEDDELERQFRIWRQETPDQPWEALSTSHTYEADECEAELAGFTRYAVAY
jgi:hypothetical protein